MNPLFESDEERRQAVVLVAGAMLHAILHRPVYAPPWEGSISKGEPKRSVTEAFIWAEEFVRQAVAL